MLVPFVDKWSEASIFFSDFFLLIEQRTAAARVLGNIHYSTERFPRFSRFLDYTQWTLHIFLFKCFVAALEDFRVALMKWVFISVLMWQARVGTRRTLSSFFGARWHTHTKCWLMTYQNSTADIIIQRGNEWRGIMGLLECLWNFFLLSSASVFMQHHQHSLNSHFDEGPHTRRTQWQSGEEKWKF